MARSRSDEESPNNSPSDQAANLLGWEKFLPDRALHILLVEEDSSTRQVVGGLLSKCGYEVSSTSDGMKAWDLLEQKDRMFDLVLADAMVLPQSGTDLLTKIMSSEIYRDIPVVMMSSHDSLDTVFKCLLKGAKDFLVKPLRKNELRNLWQHVWRRNHESARVGSEGNGQNKKRKAKKNSCSEDTSNDNFSVSSVKDDQNVRSNAKISGVRRSDIKVKLEFNEVLGSKCNEFHCEGGLYSPSRQRAVSRQDSGTSGRSTKAFDFIGTMTTEPVPAHDSSNSKHGKPLQQSHKCQASPALELTLRRTDSTSNAWCDSAGRQGVHQSNYSAFTKYTGKASVMQQQCIARSASLPIDQCLLAPCLNEITESCLEIPDKDDERVPNPENSGSQTLHYPKATHFSYGRQFGNSPLSLLSSCRDENGRYAGQGNSPSNFGSPSFNSSTANSLLQGFKEIPTVNNDQLSKLSKHKEAHFTGSMTGSVWCGSDKEDLGSSNGNLGQFSSCSNAKYLGQYKDEYTLYEENLHSKPSEVDGFSSGKEDAAFQEMQAYTVVSGRGSNDGSERGSGLIEENLAGKSVNCSAAPDGNLLGIQQLPVANERAMMDMDCCGATDFDEGNASHLKSVLYDYKSSFREAALFKFRQKRKMRCFEKKVRYQSRKKLAEQRPRVKGQFVRRAVYDTAATT